MQALVRLFSALCRSQQSYHKLRLPHPAHAIHAQTLARLSMPETADLGLPLPRLLTTMPSPRLTIWRPGLSPSVVSPAPLRFVLEGKEELARPAIGLAGACAKEAGEGRPPPGDLLSVKRIEQVSGIILLSQHPRFPPCWCACSFQNHADDERRRDLGRDRVNSLRLRTQHLGAEGQVRNVDALTTSTAGACAAGSHSLTCTPLAVSRSPSPP